MKDSNLFAFHITLTSQVPIWKNAILEKVKNKLQSYNTKLNIGSQFSFDCLSFDSVQSHIYI